MNNYPSFPIEPTSFAKEYDDGRRDDKTLGGQQRTQFMYQGVFYAFSVTHVFLSREEAQMFESFYEANKVGEFEFYNPEDWNTYVCRFTSKPEFSRFTGLHRDVTLKFRGVKQ